MTAAELRQRYLDFFATHGHAAIPSASLIPENDPTVLFTTAGMHPLVPYLLGEKHPSGTRLASCQKCIRTGDIDEVGDDTHLTFFEMLGNWSLGDYFKRDAITWSFEFLTRELGFPVERLAVSVFAGDADAPRDEEAAKMWLEASNGTLAGRIDYLPKAKNWWGPAGQSGPCGPDTEMFIWVPDTPPPAKIEPGDLAKDGTGWVEIWNDVFMQFNKTAEGTFEPLAKPNVDTGMGLERVITVLQKKKSVYETDLFTGILAQIRACATERDERAERIIADHLRAATFIIGDPRGVPPSNVDQGYVVRKLIRRAIRFARKLGVRLGETFTTKIAKVVIAEYGAAYPELRQNNEKILAALTKEEEQFKKTLERGEREIGDFIASGNAVDGTKAFYFYETYGFPRELTDELLAERGKKMDNPDGFEAAFAKHRELSRAGSEAKFAGGLADHSAETTALHTAAHLLQAALRKVLGDHVAQRGSNITAERLRFDFSHPAKMTLEEIAKVEAIVNEQIRRDLPITREEMTVDEAKAAGAIGLFESKYGEKVKVYTMGDFSKEICGGPHVEHTGLLGAFKIQKEEASSAGVRRIKAVLVK